MATRGKDRHKLVRTPGIEPPPGLDCNARDLWRKRNDPAYRDSRNRRAREIMREKRFVCPSYSQYPPEKMRPYFREYYLANKWRWTGYSARCKNRPDPEMALMSFEIDEHRMKYGRILAEFDELVKPGSPALKVDVGEVSVSRTRGIEVMPAPPVMTY